MDIKRKKTKPSDTRSISATSSGKIPPIKSDALSLKASASGRNSPIIHETQGSSASKLSDPLVATGALERPGTSKAVSRKIGVVETTAAPVNHDLLSVIRPSKLSDPLVATGALEKPGTSKAASRKIGSVERTVNTQPPSKRAYKDKRAALSVLHRLKKIPEGERTVQQKASLSWATKIVGVEDKTRPQSTNSSNKRQRSQEETTHPESKKSRGLVATSKTFSEVLAGHTTVAVIDRSDPDGNISHDNWRKVEVRLAQAFLPILKEYPGSTPVCRDSGWFQGHVKLITCADQRSLVLYKTAISRIGNVWPGAKLEVVAKEDIPSRPRARSWIPAEPSDPMIIMEIICTSNPELHASNWKVTKLEEPKGDCRSVTFAIDQESLAPLASSGGVIGYGFSSINIRVFKKDAEVHAKKDAPGTSKTAQKLSEDVSDPEHVTNSAPTSIDLPESSGSDSELAVMLGSSSLDEEALLDSDNESDITVVETETTCSHHVAGGSD